MLSLEYIAGYFDGEGYVGITKESSPYRPGYKVEISLTNTYLPMLQEIQEQLGGRIASWKPRTGHRMGFSLRWTGSKARSVLSILLPYLREKHAQAKIAIFFPQCPHLYNTKCSEEIRQAQEVAFQEVRRLKKVEYSL